MTSVEDIALPWLPVLGRAAGPRRAQVRRGLDAGAPLVLGDPDLDLTDVDLEEAWPLLATTPPGDSTCAERWRARGVVGVLLEADPTDGVALDRAALACHPLPLVLDLRRSARGTTGEAVRPDPLHLRRALERLRPRLLGAALPGADEELLLDLRDLEEELALLVPGREAARGWRLGAGGCIAPEGWLDPEGFLDWVAGFETDLPAALERERRLEHLLEARLEPLVRRVERDRAGAWRALLWAGGGSELAGEGGPWAEHAPELARVGAAARDLFRGEA